MRHSPWAGEDLLAAKLSSFVELNDADRDALERAYDDGIVVPSGRTLIGAGEKQKHVYCLLEGWAARSRMLADGRRQIVSFLLPGDTTASTAFIPRRMDHSIELIGSARVLAWTSSRFTALLHDNPRIAEAFGWDAACGEAVLREWIVGAGRRDALTRAAHLHCELFERLCRVRLIDGTSFNCPPTQDQLGDAIGMTSVHMNRMLRQMRLDGLIARNGKVTTILDHSALVKLAGFNADYLYPHRELRQIS